MQDKANQPEKVFKFKLPVGAIVSGMRHLGDGVFAGYLLPEVGKLGMMDGGMPIIIEGVVSASDGENWDNKLHVEIVDDPMHGIEAARVLNLVQLPGGQWSDTHIALGLSDEDGRSRTESRTRYGKIVHEAKLAAFREVYSRHSGKTWGGRERGWIDATETAINDDAEYALLTMPDVSGDPLNNADHQCCGKCEKPEADAGLTAENYQAAIRDLAGRLQTADMLITALLLKSGGEVVITAEDCDKVPSHIVMNDPAPDGSGFTFRAVPIPEQVVQ